MSRVPGGGKNSKTGASASRRGAPASRPAHSAGHITESDEGTPSPPPTPPTSSSSDGEDSSEEALERRRERTRRLNAPPRDSQAARRGRFAAADREAPAYLEKVNLAPGDQPPFRAWIHEQRNAAIDRAGEEGVVQRRRASLYADPVLRITEDRTLTYAQQRDALQRLALDQHIAAQERSALTKQAEKRKQDKLDKRKRAREQCAEEKQPHKRRGGSPPGPSFKPTPRAEYSTVGLGLRVKA
jgi:hypothetical protein